MTPTLFILNAPPYGTERSADGELAKGTRRSTLDELSEWTRSADRVLVF